MVASEEETEADDEHAVGDAEMPASHASAIVGRKAKTTSSAPRSKDGSESEPEEATG